MSGGRPNPSEVVPIDYYDLVTELEIRELKFEAMMALRGAGEAAKPALFAGLEHPAWRVRYGCLRVLDHTIVDDETRVRIVEALADPHRKVRRAALHVLGCETCKPEGFCGIEGVDIDGAFLDIIENDPSLHTRRSALGAFMWGRDDLPERVEVTMKGILATETDPQIRQRAAMALLWPEVFNDKQSDPRERWGAFKKRVTELAAG